MFQPVFIYFEGSSTFLQFIVIAFKMCDAITNFYKISNHINCFLEKFFLFFSNVIRAHGILFYFEEFTPGHFGLYDVYRNFTNVVRTVIMSETKGKYIFPALPILSISFIEENEKKEESQTKQNETK